jgi:NNP family nitrate/nitrite transporter-like MFS transporter
MTTTGEKATRIDLFSFGTVQMRTFHLTWLAFFICFFGWFSHAPLLPATIGPDLDLTKAQKITAFIASVGVTIFARLLIGYICDRIGPRKAYVYLLGFGAVAVAGSSFANTWETYLFSRLCIGVIGASFVITQYHTSVMFASNTVGIANATTAGWGNLGGGVTQAVMPMVAAAMASRQ